jgi:hypothetical protein
MDFTNKTKILTTNKASILLDKIQVLLKMVNSSLLITSKFSTNKYNKFNHNNNNLNNLHLKKISLINVLKTMYLAAAISWEKDLIVMFIWDSIHLITNKLPLKSSIKKVLE